MKKVLSFMLVLAMLMTQFVMPVFADAAGDDYWYDDPYEELEVESVTVTVSEPLIENASGWYEDVCDENGEVTGTFFYYDVDYANPTVTVVYENGDVEEDLPYNLYGDVEIYNDQYEKAWGLGKHSVTLVYRGVEATFEVEIVETPVKSVTAVAQNKLIDGLDSWVEVYTDDEGNEVETTLYYWGRVEVLFTVTMKDGTAIKGNEDEIYEQTGYFVNNNIDQYENPFVIGKNKVEYTFMNVSCEGVIEVIPNPYKGVTLKGENEVYLVFEGIDEKDTYESKITEVYFEELKSEGCYYATIFTDDEKFYDAILYCDINDDGEAILNKNVCIEIGPFITNTLATCNYFKAEYIRESIIYNSVNYYATCEAMIDKPFNSYNAEEPDIDHLVALSTYVGRYYSEIEYSDFGMIYKLSVEECEKNIEEIFGITDVDVKESEFYNRKLFGGEVVVEDYNSSMYPEEIEMVFKDGKWVITSDIFDNIYGIEAMVYVGKITVVLNEDGTVCSIDIEKIEIEAGDVNCDGAVTAVDARLVLQYVAGLIGEYEFNTFYSDLNDDGAVTAVDARLILQKVAGLIE